MIHGRRALRSAAAVGRGVRRADHDAAPLPFAHYAAPYAAVLARKSAAWC